MNFRKAITSTILLLCVSVYWSRAMNSMGIAVTHNCDPNDCGDAVKCAQGGAYVPPGECCAACPDCSVVRCANPDCAGNFTLPGHCCLVCPSDQCTRSYCQNGGTCYASFNGVVGCWCPNGFSGDKCEIGPGKPGSCPSSKGMVGTCVEACENDNSCDGNQRCCSNGCGHVCMEPVLEKPGSCPSSKGMVGTCVEACENDNSCDGNQRCCSNGCGHVCMEPVLEKPGSCPNTDGMFGTCVEACENDNSCDGNQRCCSNGCGHVCMEPVLEKPGSCPNTNGMFGTCVEACENDNSCDGNQRCCSNGCGHTCMEPVYDDNSCKHMGSWYDSTFYDACNECTCIKGEKACTKMKCDTSGCRHGDRWYADRERFKNECNDCSCNNGSVSCTEKACVKACDVNGVWYHEGESYKLDCNTCMCQANGFGMCTEIACDQNGCLYGDKWHANGASFVSEDGCNTCYCEKGSVSCTEMACLVTCTHGATKYDAGQTYQDDCNTCMCGNDGKTRCTEKSCPPPDCTTVKCTNPGCTDGVIPQGMCCPVCDQGCNVNDTVINDGAVFFCSGGCADCECVEGSVEIVRCRSCYEDECPVAAAGLGVAQLTWLSRVLSIMLALCFMYM